MKKPYLIMAVLDIVGRMWDVSDYRMHQFLSMLFRRKVDYLRIFLFCSWGKQGKSSQPYLQLPNGKFDLELFNPSFFFQLKRLAEMCYQWKVALYVDLFDNCALGKKWRHLHPYENNINGVKGMYDESKLAQDYRNRLATKVIETIGLRGTYYAEVISWKIRPNLFGLINEGKCDDTKPAQTGFGRDWAYPLASHLRKLGYEGKIMFSAYDPAAHAIQGWVSSDEHWKSEFKKGDTVRQLHGIWDISSLEEKKKPVTHRRWFATSTDGTFDKNPSINMVCGIVDWSMGTAKEEKLHYHHHEELPLSIADVGTYFHEINKDRDLEVYSAIRRRVFGIKKPNRKVPKWLLKRTGLKRGKDENQT